MQWDQSFLASDGCMVLVVKYRVHGRSGSSSARTPAVQTSHSVTLGELDGTGSSGAYYWDKEGMKGALVKLMLSWSAVGE